VEEPLMLRWFAEILYPGQISGSLRTEYKKTYAEVYHYSVSDDEIDRTLYLKDNLQSAGYERFARASQPSMESRPVH
jgi:hypothetical protein